MIDFGHKLKVVREKLEMKQALFAERLGVKQSFYSLVESNKTSLPLTKSVILFSEMRVNPKWFFSPDENISDDDIFTNSPGSMIDAEISNGSVEIVKNLTETIRSQQNTIEQLTQCLFDSEVISDEFKPNN